MAQDSGAPAPVAGTPPAISATQGSFNSAAATAGDEAREDAAAAIATRQAAEKAAAEAAAAEPVTITAAPPPPAALPTPAAVVDDKGVAVFEASGNPKLDLALGFIGKLGLGPDHAAVKAAENGDFSILKATLAMMGDKAAGYEAVIALGESAYADVVTASKARAAADRTAMMAVAGGEEQWASIRAFAAAATADSPAEAAEVNRVLAGGGLAAKAMVGYLKGLHDAHAPHKEPQSVVSVNSAAPAAPSASTAYALSPRQYTAEVSKLAATMRGRMDGSPEYKALQARRAAWRESR